MAKNLVFLADGTGNDSDISAATNVYKMYQRLRNDLPGHVRLTAAEIERFGADIAIEQITQYDAGVGSGPLDLVGKATGKGISKNIKDGYEFFCRFYEPGDRIYLFGFSRGAYTVRSLGGLIGLCGVPRRRQGEDGDLLHDDALRLALVEEAFRIYRLQPGPEGDPLRRAEADKFIAAHGDEAMTDAARRAPYMIGVWDTVRSLGIPLRWGDVELPGQKHRFHDHELNPYVPYAFHALSIDDERMQFYPTIWNEPTLARQKQGLGEGQTFSQVWFPGVHADVGGGYDGAGLSDVTLKWMIGKACLAEHPPLFQGEFTLHPFAGLRPEPTADAHDPRDTLWKKVIYSVQPRDVVRGRQQAGARRIEPFDPAEEAYLDRCLEARLEAYHSRGLGAPKVVATHSDIVLLLKQIAERLMPRGPFRFME